MCDGWCCVCAAVSIVERERQVLKSTGGTMPRTVVPRSASFCQHTFVHKLPVVMVIEDTYKDARWDTPSRILSFQPGNPSYLVRLASPWRKDSRAGVGVEQARARLFR